MASVNRPPSLADKGVSYVLGLNIIVGIVAMLVFSYLRWRYQNSKSREPDEEAERARGGHDPPPAEPNEETGLLKGRPKGEPFFGYILPLIKMKPLEHLQRIGYDAMLYFYFQRSVIVFLVVIMVFGMAVVPVNYFGGKNLEGFLSTTVANVTDPALYWVHAAVTVLFSISLYIFLWHLRSNAINSNNLLLDRYKSVKSAVSVHTIWIRNYPRDCLNVNILKTHFEELIQSNFRLRRLLEESKSEKKLDTMTEDEAGDSDKDGGSGESSWDGSSSGTDDASEMTDETDHDDDDNDQEKGSMQITRLGSSDRMLRTESWSGREEEEDEESKQEGEGAEGKDNTRWYEQALNEKELYSGPQRAAGSRKGSASGPEGHIPKITTSMVAHPDKAKRLLHEKHQKSESTGGYRFHFDGGEGYEGPDIEMGSKLKISHKALPRKLDFNKKRKRRRQRRPLRPVKVKRRSTSSQPMIITQSEDVVPTRRKDEGWSDMDVYGKNGVTKHSSLPAGNEKDWTEIDLKKNYDEVEREKRIKRQKEKLLYKEIDGGVVSINIVPELKDVIYYSELYRDACSKLDYYKSLRHTNGYRARISAPPGAGIWEWLWHKITFKGDVDAIVEYKAWKKTTYMQMERAKRDMNNSTSTGVVFATFTSNALAKEIVSIYGEHTRLSNSVFSGESLTRYSSLLKDNQWFVRLAPEPEDVIWANLGISRMEKRLRVFIVNIALLAFFSFFTTPLGILSTLQNLLPWVTGTIGTLLGTAGAFLVAYLPTIILMTFTFLLPMIIYWSSVPEGHQTTSITHKWLVVKTYLYFLFNILILPSLFLTSIDALIEKTWLNRHQLWEIVDVEKFLPFSSAFLVCYVLNMAVVGCTVEVSRISDRIQYFWFKWRAVTPEEHEVADSWACPHEYGMEYAYQVVIFCTTFAYAPMVPLFIPAGLFYFCCKHFVDSYHLVNVRPINFKSDGSMIWLVLQAVLITSTISQSGMAIFLLLHGTFAQFFIVALLPLSVLIAHLYIYSTGQESWFSYHKEKKKVLMRRANWIEVFRLAYVHEILRNERQQELQDQIEAERTRAEEEAEKVHSTATRRRLLRRMSTNFGTFASFSSFGSLPLPASPLRRSETPNSMKRLSMSSSLSSSSLSLPVQHTPTPTPSSPAETPLPSPGPEAEEEKV